MNRNIHTYHRAAIILCGLIIVLSGCRFGRRPEPTLLPITLPTRFSGTPSQPLATYTVERGTVIKEESYTGRVVLARQNEMFFRRNGRVVAIYVQDGDTVQEGDIIAELDSELLQLDLEAAQLGVEIATEDIEQAEEALRIRRLQAQLTLENALLQFQRQQQSRQVTITSSVSSPVVDLSLNNRTTLTSSLITPSIQSVLTSTLDVKTIDLTIQQNQVALAQLAFESIDREINPVLRLNLRRSEIAVERIKQSILEGQLIAPFDGQVRFISLSEDEEQKAVSAYSCRGTSGRQYTISDRAQLTSCTNGTALRGAPSGDCLGGFSGRDGSGCGQCVAPSLWH